MGPDVKGYDRASMTSDENVACVRLSRSVAISYDWGTPAN